MASSPATAAASSSSSAPISLQRQPVLPGSRASNRASFRPLAILSDDGQPVVQPAATPAQPATVDSSDAEPAYELDDAERQPATIYSGGDYHEPLSSSASLDNSADNSAAEYTAAEADPALVDEAAALSLYDNTILSTAPYASAVSGPASGLPAYPTQPSGHVSLPARSLTSSQSTAAQSPSPQFMFADNSGLAVQSQPQRSFFMNETLRERLLFHQQLAADRLLPEGEIHSQPHTQPSAAVTNASAHCRPCRAVPCCQTPCSPLCL